MSTLKKITCIFMACIIVFSSFALIVCNAQAPQDVKFSVATDIHTTGKVAKIPVYYEESELYFQSTGSGNLYNESIGIFMDYLDEVKDAGLDFILIPGDTAHAGTKAQHTYFASILEKFEKESGIPVYIVPGNHDYFNGTTPAQYMEYYKNFGYSEALVLDEKTASYTADLPGGYRLIAIDSNLPGGNGDGIDDRLMSWIGEQAKAAENDGKTVISMMHHPLLDPIPFAEILMGDFVVQNNDAVAEKFTEWGIQYLFTGHEHGNNISSYTGKNGKTVYDILTTALTAYPLEYRLITLGSAGMDIKCKSIDTCNFEMLPAGFTDAQLAAMEEDFNAYALGYFKYTIEKKIGSFITPEFISKKLKVTEGELYDAIYAVVPLIEEALQMPLYKKDTDGVSIESLANSCSATLPESDYYNLYDLATTVVAAVYYGSENMPTSETPEGKILMIGLNTGLKYILAEAGNRTATLALNAIAGSIGLDKIDGVDIYRWNRALVLGADHSYDVAFSVLSPLMDKFVIDDELCDRDIVLPAPGDFSKTTPSQSVFEKILSFIRYFFNILRTVLFIKIG